jgi:DNA-binding NarL/FixJ family response regulator
MPQESSVYSSDIFSDYEWVQLLKELDIPPRQADVIKCLFSGYSDKQIASHTNLAISTVRTHISRAFRKFDLNDREELILHIIRHFRNGCRQLDCPRKRLQ